MDQVTTLNNEGDWRNGMRVKLLKQVVLDPDIFPFSFSIFTFGYKKELMLVLFASGKVWTEKTTLEGF